MKIKFKFIALVATMFFNVSVIADSNVGVQDLTGENINNVGAIYHDSDTKKINSTERVVPISPDRIKWAKIKFRTFANNTQSSQLAVIDVTVDDVQDIFSELYEKQFPIYATSSYVPRNIVNSNRPSLHAYGAAIDANYLMNPYYNVLNGPSSIIPGRAIDREEDDKGIRSGFQEIDLSESETEATLNATIQEEGSEDWFLNREILRKGMFTSKEAEIFAKHGFTVWGGLWKQPMDFMHFQLPRGLAEQLASVVEEEAKTVWKNHVLITEYDLQLKDRLAKLNPAEREEMLSDHMIKCERGQGYFMAANSQDSAEQCISHCQQQIDYIDAIDKIAVSD